MRWLIRIIETTTDIISGHLQAWLTLALMVLVMINVVSRYVMRNPLSIAEEYGGFCLVGITCITRSHVRVEFIVNKLPPRAQNWLRLFTLLLAFFFTGFMIYAAYELVNFSFMFGTRSTSWLRTPIAWPQITIVIGAALMFLQLIVEIIYQIRRIMSPQEEDQ